MDAVVYKVTPFGIFINLFNNKIRAKIPQAKDKSEIEEVKVGDKMKVVISYISPTKVVVERVS